MADAHQTDGIPDWPSWWSWSLSSRMCCWMTFSFQKLPLCSRLSSYNESMYRVLENAIAVTKKDIFLFYKAKTAVNGPNVCQPFHNASEFWAHFEMPYPIDQVLMFECQKPVANNQGTTQMNQKIKIFFYYYWISSSRWASVLIAGSNLFQATLRTLASTWLVDFKLRQAIASLLFDLPLNC